ncbi:hypothetical protein THAOC_35523, partial [Thalassiosira oceanica]
RAPAGKKRSEHSAIGSSVSSARRRDDQVSGEAVEEPAAESVVARTATAPPVSERASRPVRTRCLPDRAPERRTEAPAVLVGEAAKRAAGSRSLPSRCGSSPSKRFAGGGERSTASHAPTAGGLEAKGWRLICTDLLCTACLLSLRL